MVEPGLGPDYIHRLMHSDKPSPSASVYGRAYVLYSFTVDRYIDVDLDIDGYWRIHFHTYAYITGIYIIFLCAETMAYSAWESDLLKACNGE